MVKNLTKEHKENIRKSMKGKCARGIGWHHTQETKDKIGRAVSGENNAMFGKFGSKHHAYGTHHTVKTKEKIRNSTTKDPNSMYNILQRRGVVVPKGHVRHHYDFNKKNNVFENFRFPSKREHIILHAQAGRRAVYYIRCLKEKSIISKELYDGFLAFVNQDGSVV